MRIDLQKEVLTMIEAMREVAVSEVLSRFGQLGLDGSVDFTISTEADRSASLALIGRCKDRFPGSYSEEHLLPERFTAPSGYIWQFDPVDGTIDFANSQRDGFAMHAALLEKQADQSYLPVAGIIYLPGLDRLWYGWQDGPVSCIEAGVEGAVKPATPGELRCYLWRFFDNPNLRRACAAIASALPGHAKSVLVPCGAMGSGVSALLGGEIDIIIANQDSSKEWDVAMALPLVQARGGFICDCDGQEFASFCRADPWNRRGVIMSITYDKEAVLSHLPRDIVQDIVFSKSAA